MNLKKIGKYYWVDYRVAGKRYRRSTGTGNRKLAEAWLEKLNIARRMPTFEAAVDVLRILYQKPTEGKLPIESAWEIYEGLAKATGKDALAERTMDRRRNRVERLVRWLKKKLPTVRTLEKVNGAVAVDFAQSLADEGLKTKTRANILGDLGTVWRLLEKASEEIRNPWGSLMPQDTDGERGKAFSPDEERRVLEAAKSVGKDWWAVCTLMRHTGLRYGDVATLKWSEVGSDAIRLEPRKTKRHRISVAIPVTEPVQQALATLERRDDYVFPVHAHLYGKRGRASREALSFREVLEAAGLGGDGFTVHSWRHTAATRLAGAGVGIETRKRILGHTEDATAERYDHDEHLAEVRAAMEAAAG